MVRVYFVVLLLVRTVPVACAFILAELVKMVISGH